MTSSLRCTFIGQCQGSQKDTHSKHVFVWLSTLELIQNLPYSHKASEYIFVVHPTLLIITSWINCVTLFDITVFRCHSIAKTVTLTQFVIATLLSCKSMERTKIWRYSSLQHSCYQWSKVLLEKTFMYHARKVKVKKNSRRLIVNLRKINLMIESGFKKCDWIRRW